MPVQRSFWLRKGLSLYKLLDFFRFRRFLTFRWRRLRALTTACWVKKKSSCAYRQYSINESAKLVEVREFWKYRHSNSVDPTSIYYGTSMCRWKLLYFEVLFLDLVPLYFILNEFDLWWTLQSAGNVFFFSVLACFVLLSGFLCWGLSLSQFVLHVFSFNSF